jgi:tetratricopeptide (TPR) repeat protein
MSGSTTARFPSAALVAIPVFLILLAGLQRKIDASAASLQEQKPELLFRSGTMLKKMSFGYDSLLADIYWTRAVQYFGARVGQAGATFELLAPLLDITTTIDPKFMLAYRFGAIFLSEPPPAGADRPDLAVALVKKGIAANPDEWRLYQDLGFIYSMHLKDYQKAADAYLEGSKNPQAQIWMKVLAARVAESGDSIETSKMIWREVYASTQDPLVRKSAVGHMQALDAAADLKRLNESSEAFRMKFGHDPATMQEMRDAGLVRGELQDPAGYSYVMGPGGMPQLDPGSPVVVDPNWKKSNR